MSAAEQLLLPLDAAPTRPRVRHLRLVSAPQAAYQRSLALLAQPLLPLGPPIPLPRPHRPSRPAPEVRRHALAKVIPLRPAGLGGPDPEKPCDGCAKRAGCKAPCVLLNAALDMPEEINAWAEIGSPALMAGRGNIDAVMVQPEVDREEEPNLLWPRVVAAYGPKLRPAIAHLPRVQQEVLHELLAGRERYELTDLRGVSRQAIHKVFWAAVRTLRRILGALDTALLDADDPETTA
jgi:hypothetical protein